MADERTPPKTTGGAAGQFGLRQTQLAAGAAHTCAVTEGGALYCWGRGTDGRLGYANTNPIGDDETPGQAGAVPVGAAVVGVALGSAHTCALLTSGSVRCWGDGALGQLGYGNLRTIGDNETPATVSDDPDATPAR